LTEFVCLFVCFLTEFRSLESQWRAICGRANPASLRRRGPPPPPPLDVGPLCKQLGRKQLSLVGRLDNIIVGLAAFQVAPKRRSRTPPSSLSNHQPALPSFSWAFTEFYPSSISFHGVLLGCTGLYWVFTVFKWVLLGFTGFNCA